MIFQRCHIRGFGRLNSLALDFHKGLNLVFAPNEAGKSTLQRFLIALLYGQLRPEVKAQRRLDPWVDAYRPWRGSDYGGALWCRLAGGREIEIRRTFGKDDARLEIRSVTGEDITREYEQQRNGDVLFARFHFGLPKELFESVAVIRENKAAELDGHDTIRDRIANLAQSGDEELSVQQSLQELEAALEALGSDRAPTRPYRQTLDRLQALQQEMKALETRRKEYEDWLRDRGRLGGEVLRLEERLRTSQSAVLTARWRETTEKVHTLEGLDGEIRSLRREIDLCEGNENFPVHHLENLNELVGAGESVDKRLAEIRKELEAASKSLASSVASRETLLPYECLASSGDADKITGWFVGYLRLSTHRDEAQRSISRHGEEIRVAKDQLGRLGPALTDPSVDWQAKAMEAAEAAREGAAECLHLAEVISEQKAILSRAQSKTARLRMLGIVTMILVLLPGAAWLLLGPEHVPGLLACLASLLLATAAVPLLGGAAKSHEAERKVVEAISTLESNRTRVREESQQRQRQIEQAMKSAGFATVDEFLAAAKRAEQWRQKMTDLEGRIHESELQRGALAAECTELYSRLQDLLARVGLSCSPGTVKAQVDVFRENLKRFRELDDTYRSSVRQVESLKIQETELAAEAEEKDTRIQAILDEAGTDSPEAFREACEKRRRLLELIERESSRVREFKRLCGNLSLKKWQTKLQELELLKQEMPDTGSQESPDNLESKPSGARLPYLPYLPTVSETEMEERRISALLAAAREEHARIIERVKQAFHNCREASEIEEDLEQEARSLRALERNRASLDLALQTIRALSREQQEVLAPQLNRAVELRFLRLCQGRYPEVKIDPDFNIWVREGDNGELRRAMSLSRGTQDQLYLALRFGILDLVANSEESCPCLLDEPFAAYDRARMFEAFRILQEEAARRQLVLFTCREDLRAMARAQGAHILQLAYEK